MNELLACSDKIPPLSPCAPAWPARDPMSTSAHARHSHQHLFCRADDITARLTAQHTSTRPIARPTQRDDRIGLIVSHCSASHVSAPQLI